MKLSESFHGFLLSLLLGLTLTRTASAVPGGSIELPTRTGVTLKRIKRTEVYVAPQFSQQFYTFDESSFVNGARLVPTVCLRGGQYHDRSEFLLLAASGPEDNCFGQPCPPATFGVDYSVSTERFFLRTRELRCFNFTIVDDEEIEGPEFFLLALEDLRWGEVVSIASITIIDDDSPTFAAAEVSYVEDAGTVPVCVRGGDIDMPVILQSVANISNATVGEDYVQVFSEFTLGSDEELCVDVTIIDDTLYEGDHHEVVTLVFTNADEANGTFSIHSSLLIVDNDPTPKFTSTLYTVTESDGQVEVCVEFDAEPTLTVESRIATRDDSAKENVDYIGLDETFMISGGVQVCRMITIITNTVPERLTSFTVEMTSSNSVVSEPLTTVVAILDDDILDFEDDLYIINEADKTARICVTVVSGDINAPPVNATIITKDGSAKENDDYHPIRFGFTVRNGRRCFTVTVDNDGIEEPDEHFFIGVLTLTPDNSLVGQRFTTVIIRDESTQGLNCTALSPPTNGNIMFTNANNIGSVATYLCNLGFILAGLVDTNRRTCMLDGTWTGNDDPTCEVLQCPQLNDPQDGMVTVPDRNVNSVATYTCNNGFRLEGDEERVCAAQIGEWTGNVPTCILIVCPRLVNPVNGLVTVGLRTLNSRATYSCLAGFVLTPMEDQMRTCLMSGEWSGTEPQCRTLGEPLEIDLVNDSPNVDDRMVSVDFRISGIADNVVCKLDNIVIEEDFQSRSSGSMSFTDVEPGVHNLEITASNSEETVVVGRVFELSDHPDFCGLHLINKGLTINGDSIRVEFVGRPPAKAYRCKLDNDPGFDCNELVEMEGVAPGTHRLKIMHNRAECGPRRKLFLHFTI